MSVEINEIHLTALSGIGFLCATTDVYTVESEGEFVSSSLSSLHENCFHNCTLGCTIIPGRNTSKELSETVIEI